ASQIGGHRLGQGRKLGSGHDGTLVVFGVPVRSSPPAVRQQRDRFCGPELAVTPFRTTERGGSLSCIVTRVGLLVCDHVDPELREIAGDYPDMFRDLFAAHPEVTLTDYRSEEHTSELQSRENLVCRLLLEKKKNKKR